MGDHTGQPKISPLAGKPAPKDILVDLAKLERDYFEREPDPAQPTQAVSFGTSGHRGTAGMDSFNQMHVWAITQAICDYRKANQITGPTYLGKDTHALSKPAEQSALEVLAANGVETIVQSGEGFTPTPVVSRAILVYNRGRSENLADGILLTPSHNPPQDGGLKYNPPNGGPAETMVTQSIQNRANQILRAGKNEIKRMPYEQARKAACIHVQDLTSPYVRDLQNVVAMAAIKEAKLKIAVDPLGGAGRYFWEPINELYGTSIEVVNPAIDPAFSFMSVDHDGKIRMDCSSSYAMAGLLQLKDQYRLAFANDPDADRHGIVSPSAGLLNPNHYLAVAIDYLLTHRPNWNRDCLVGKTMVSSSLIDKVVEQHQRRLYEVPVGFKWFAPGLFDGTCCFGGEESAGASFLRLDGSVWATDKDGIIMNLLAAEIIALTGKDPGELYQDLAEKFGKPYYTRIDAPASPEQKTKLQNLTPDAVKDSTLAGDPISAKLTKAPGNEAAFGGLKVASKFGWFAARPSGTEALYKIYAESFLDEAHLSRVVEEAQGIVRRALGS